VLPVDVTGTAQSLREYVAAVLAATSRVDYIFLGAGAPSSHASLSCREARLHGIVAELVARLHGAFS
jgi:hypothetical protein